MTSITLERYKNEELINTYTHIPGAALGILFIYLLFSKTDENSIAVITSYIVYSITFMMCFISSIIYHGVNHNSDLKQFLKKVDHSCIYIFIGGCYTPFVVINMTDTIKYWFLAFVWTIVLFGVIYKFASSYKNSKLSLILYFSFAFMCFLVWDDFLDKIPDLSFNFLVYGGVFYSIGAIFYAVRSIPYNHAFWHIFTILGAICHFYAVYTTQ